MGFIERGVYKSFGGFSSCANHTYKKQDHALQNLPKHAILCLHRKQCACVTILYKPETSIYRRTQTHDFFGPSLEESPAWSCSTMMEEWPPWSCRETLYRANPYIKRKTQEKMPKNVLFVSLWTAADWSPPGPPGWSLALLVGVLAASWLEFSWPSSNTWKMAANWAK